MLQGLARPLGLHTYFRIWYRRPLGFHEHFRKWRLRPLGFHECVRIGASGPSDFMQVSGIGTASLLDVMNVSSYCTPGLLDVMNSSAFGTLGLSSGDGGGVCFCAGSKRTLPAPPPLRDGCRANGRWVLESHRVQHHPWRRLVCSRSGLRAGRVLSPLC